jgi:circadian clock protein KaiB
MPRKSRKRTNWDDLPPAPKYRLRLFVSGATPRATLAVSNVKAITEKHLDGRYELEVIDALQNSELVRGQQIVVLPTLIRELPLPIKRLMGDMSDEEQVLIGLGLIPDEPKGSDGKK